MAKAPGTRQHRTSIRVTINLHDPLQLASQHGGHPGKAFSFFARCLGQRSAGAHFVTSKIVQIIRQQVVATLQEHGLEAHSELAVRQKGNGVIVMEAHLVTRRVLRAALGRMVGTVVSCAVPKRVITDKILNFLRTRISRALKENDACSGATVAVERLEPVAAAEELREALPLQSADGSRRSCGGYI